MGRHERTKRAKKAMTFYKMNYHLTPPYFVLLDPEFVEVSLEKKVFAKTAVPEVLGGTSVLVVTRCVTAHLRAGGEARSAAALMAKRLQHEECRHDSHIDPHDCLYSLLLTQETREKKLCLASQNPEFRKRARTLPGVPIMHIYNNMVILDPPSRASMAEAANKARSHRSLNSLEQTLVKKAIPQSEEKAEEKAIPQRIIKTRRRAKGPNPLSMLKKGALKKRGQHQHSDRSVSKSRATDGGTGDSGQPRQEQNATSQHSTPSVQQIPQQEEGNSEKRKRKRKRKHGGKKKSSSEDANDGALKKRKTEKSNEVEVSSGV